MSHPTRAGTAIVALAFAAFGTLAAITPVIGQSPPASIAAPSSLSPCPSPIPAASSSASGASVIPAAPSAVAASPAPILATPCASSAPATAGTSVSIQDFSFQPATLSVPVGASVTWTNNDTTSHTVTADDGSFDSGPVAPGMTFTQVFATAGTFTYHCKIHPSMTASITVR